MTELDPVWGECCLHAKIIYSEPPGRNPMDIDRVFFRQNWQSILDRGGIVCYTILTTIYYGTEFANTNTKGEVL